MILKALADYYERMLNDPECDVARPGWFWGRLDYVVSLDGQGNFKSIRSLQTEQDGRLVGRTSLLPFIGKQALKHANSGKDANLLWDNSSFVLGLGGKGELKLESFISAIKKSLGDSKDDAIESLILFLNKELASPDAYMQILSHPEYGEGISSGQASITFELDSDQNCFVFQREQISEKISDLTDTSGPVGTCLVTGKTGQPIEQCHVVIKNLYGAKKDPNLISFNKDSFSSYGKSQSLNSPVSTTAAFAYTTALNHLLRNKSRQKFQLGDTSTVFWARENHEFEDEFTDFLGEPPKEVEPDYGKIRSLLSAVKKGVRPPEDDIPFYILGIAPNAARISVRFWYAGDIRDVKQRIAQHFEDLEVVRAPHDREFLSLKQLLLATSRHSTKYPFGDREDIAPNLGGEIFRAVINGTTYPRTILQKMVNRVKSEQGLCDKKGKQLANVTHARAALIKGFLVRDSRLKGINTKEVGKMLDKTNVNIGYVLGRLFAALEKIQIESHKKEGQKKPELNKTIRDTYFSAATSNPLVIFKRLQDLAIHHLAKIRNSGKSTVWLDKLMQEVMDKIPASGIPVTLSLEDQGRFAVGYYHQRQDFFNKIEDETKGE
ncbi:MAG: type I-C CRISPR-associated protein Cas8c/Csd1 [Desulfobulbaceae bacterium]|nr:type I-C CRISPR-associated protein Cas8c/Csd1 [Desulfobulbaceae bacterium]